MTALFQCSAADRVRTVYSIYTLVPSIVLRCVRLKFIILGQFSVNCLNSCQFCLHFAHLEHMLSVRKKKSGNKTMQTTWRTP